MTIREWVNNTLKPPTFQRDDRYMAYHAISRLCDPNCPGSADVLAEIARRREAAAKPKTQEAQ